LTDFEQHNLINRYLAN